MKSIIEYAVLILSATPLAAMIRHVAIMEPPVPLAQFDPWYISVHSAECMNLYGAWLRRYESYKSVTPASGELRPGQHSGRYTELWYENADAVREANPMRRPYSPSPWRGGLSVLNPSAHLLVPAMPTEDFLGKPGPPPSAKPMRWIIFLAYPDGVNIDEADRWYVSVHAQEAKAVPGLLRYVSYKAIPNSPLPSRYVRVTELWFKDSDAYVKAMASPLKYTTPPWVKGNEPWFVSASMLVDYNPDLVFIR